MKKLFGCALGVLLFGACSDVGTTQSVYGNSGSSLPSLKVDGGGWGGDFSMTIAGIQPMSNNTIRYTLLCRYGDQPVGFYLFLGEPPKKESNFLFGGVTLRPMGGDTSNNFLTVLALLYGVKRSKLIFADTVKGTYADLSDMSGDKTGNLAAAQFKLFFGDGSAELYMNIDKNAGTIAFPEKDKENRPALVDALTKAKSN